MGHAARIKIIVLIVCFLFVGYLVQQLPKSAQTTRTNDLRTALADIDGWKISRVTPIASNIVDALQLDDYIFQNYSNGENTVSLYIGYYMTKKKIGAAHSPLVCFPGQGWVVSDKKVTTLKVEENPLHYASITLAKGENRLLALYWFQAFDKTSPDTFRQKVNLLLTQFKSLGGNGTENNAFVRVTVPLEGKSISEAQAIGENFIESFYPKFLQYIKEEK